MSWINVEVLESIYDDFTINKQDRFSWSHHLNMNSNKCRLIRWGLQQKKKKFKNKDQTIVSHGDPEKSFNVIRYFEIFLNFEKWDFLQFLKYLRYIEYVFLSVFFGFYLRKTNLCIWVKISSCMYFRSNFFIVLNWSKSITIVSIFMNE